MRWLRRCSVGQRVVLVVGLGFTLLGVGLYLDTLGASGWVAYAPLSNGPVPAPHNGVREWVWLLEWVGLTLVWVVGSLVVLGARAPSSDAA